MGRNPTFLEPRFMGHAPPATARMRLMALVVV